MRRVMVSRVGKCGREEGARRREWLLWTAAGVSASREGKYQVIQGREK